MPSKYSKSSLSKLGRNTNLELLKIELYAIVTDLFLSKEVFNKNKDISTFITAINYDYAEYLFRSRTLLLARLLRDIKRAEKDELVLILQVLQHIYFSEIEPDTKTKSPRPDNYIDSLMDQFKRSSINE